MLQGNVIDISVTIGPDLPVYAGEEQPKRIETSSLKQGDSATVSRLLMGAHTGTHVDAPFHFVPAGETVDRLRVDSFCGRCLVVDARDAERIDSKVILENPQIREHRIVLFKTRNGDWSTAPFRKDYVALDLSAAELLVDYGIELVGIDYLSVEGFGDAAFPVHNKLLNAGVLALEGIDLQRVTPGVYTLFCLPLKIAGGDGAPARAMLVTDSKP